MKRLYPDGRGLFHDDPAPYPWHKGSLNGLIRMKIM